MRPVHFEIHAADPARAQAFYSRVFGWTFQKFGDMAYWSITTGEQGPGVNGGLVQRMGPPPGDMAPVSGYVMTIDVPDFETSAAVILAAGGTKALDRMAVPGVGWLGYFKDTEANIFGVIQSDPGAR
jgi:predicted enzyme related to lactoylglutathione lyase